MGQNTISVVTITTEYLNQRRHMFFTFEDISYVYIELSLWEVLSRSESELHLQSLDEEIERHFLEWLYTATCQMPRDEIARFLGVAPNAFILF